MSADHPVSQSITASSKRTGNKTVRFCRCSVVGRDSPDAGWNPEGGEAGRACDFRASAGVRYRRHMYPARVDWGRVRLPQLLDIGGDMYWLESYQLAKPRLLAPPEEV